MKLDKNRILELLAAADTKWFKSHSGQLNYREHLEFTADYLAKNYDRQPKKEKHREGGGDDKTTGNKYIYRP